MSALSIRWPRREHCWASLVPLPMSWSPEVSSPSFAWAAGVSFPRLHSSPSSVSSQRMRLARRALSRPFWTSTNVSTPQLRGS
jgi:hypothetical protein